MTASFSYFGGCFPCPGAVWPLGRHRKPPGSMWKCLETFLVSPVQPLCYPHSRPGTLAPSLLPRSQVLVTSAAAHAGLRLFHSGRASVCPGVSPPCGWMQGFSRLFPSFQPSAACCPMSKTAASWTRATLLLSPYKESSDAVFTASWLAVEILPDNFRKKKSFNVTYSNYDTLVIIQREIKWWFLFFSPFISSSHL